MSPAATWIDGDAGLADLVGRLLDQPAYAIDTEFHRERTYYPRLALVQVAWSGGAALIDPVDLDLNPFAAVLRGPGVAVAHAADQDLEVLDRACGAVPATLFDTQVAAGFVGFSSPSLATLAERLLDVHLPKGDRLTDWSRRPLTADQLTYAAADVAHLLALRQRLVDRLDAAGRHAWADEECARLLHRARGAQVPEAAWWRLKDSRSLRGSSRGVAQEVTAWRERRAADLDIPPRFVLPDLAVLGIAHKPPRTAEALSQVRGLDGRHARGPVVEGVLAAVSRGLDLPASALRLPAVDETDRSMRPAVALAAAWVAQLAKDEHIDASLLATRADLQALLQGAGRGRLTEGWRAEVVGRPVRRLAEGNAALVFDGRGGLLLEARSHQPLT